jgi:hypothetical protein
LLIRYHGPDAPVTKNDDGFFRFFYEGISNGQKWPGC